MSGGMLDRLNEAQKRLGQQPRPIGLGGGMAGTGPAWDYDTKAGGTDDVAGIIRDPFTGALMTARTTNGPTAPKIPKWKLEPGGGHNYAGTTVNGVKPAGAFDSNDAFRERATVPVAPKATGLMAPQPQPAAPAWSPESYQREAMEGLRAQVQAARDRKNLWDDPNAMAQQNHAAQSGWFTQQTDNMREAQARAFGGPMVTGQDLANMNSTGWAGLYGQLSNLEQQRKMNADAFEAQRGRDITGLYGQMLGAAGDPYRLEGLTHANTSARLQNEGLTHDNTQARIRNDRAMFELDQSRAVDPQVRQEAQLRLTKIQQEIDQAKQKGDWQLVEELGKAAANVAKMGGFKWLGAGAAAVATATGIGAPLAPWLAGAGAWADQALGGK